MRQARITGCLLASAIAVFATALPGTAPAAGKVLTLTEGNGGQPLVLGDFYEMDETEGVTFASAQGNVKCAAFSFGRLRGKLATNGLKKDDILLEQVFGEIAGEEECPSTTGLGPATVFMADLPWTLLLSSNGKSEIKGEIRLNFVYATTVCQYVATKIKGVTPASATPVPLTFKVKGQKFKAEKAFNLKICPKSPAMSGNFSFAFGGPESETIYAHI